MRTAIFLKSSFDRLCRIDSPVVLSFHPTLDPAQSKDTLGKYSRTSTSSFPAWVVVLEASLDATASTPKPAPNRSRAERSLKSRSKVFVASTVLPIVSRCSARSMDASRPASVNP